MAQILNSGAVIPSYLGTQSCGDFEFAGQLSNTCLRYGEVKGIVYPDDQSSQSGRYIEYTVEVLHGNGADAPALSTYPGCIVNNLFGGFADTCTYTLRTDNSNAQNVDGIGIGSKVLLLCVNGQTSSPIIIGGIRDTRANIDDKDLKSDGHNFKFRFNGFSITVNDNGEAVFQFNGKTKYNNNLDDSADPEAGGSKLTFSQDGSIQTSTKDTKESITLNHTENKIYIETPDGKIIAKSTGVLVGDATDKWMLGSTYRQAQNSLHQDIISELTKVSGKLIEAASNLAVAGTAMLVPVTGAVVAAPSITTTSIALLSIAPMINTIISKIADFEANGNSYLSDKNYND